MNRSRLIGGVLLIVGTSIGGGMLILPVATAKIGFWNSLVYLVLCWFIMTLGALFMMEVVHRFPRGSNLITMAHKTLGWPGKVVAWIAYLVLLYALLSAYIAGGSDVLMQLFSYIGIKVSNGITAVLFTALFSLIVYEGIHAVDYVNRGFMFGKLLIYILLIMIIGPHAQKDFWSTHSGYSIDDKLMILITSFSFSSIIPSLRDYFHDDVVSLKKVILWGSLIPLVCYIAWDAVIMGVIPMNGDYGLKALQTNPHATAGLIVALSYSVKSPWITGLFGFFSSICMVTAFLGVSIGLFDFLADGLKLKKRGLQGRTVLSLTFLPPLLIVLFHPGIYLAAFAYAGVCCVILLLLLPSLMALMLSPRRLNLNTVCAVLCVLMASYLITLSSF